MKGSSMATASFEHQDAVRVTLRAIVTDPALGPAVLSSPEMMLSLLSDLLPGAPRESNLLAAAAEKDLARMLRDHLASGLDTDVAVRLAASSLAASTAFTAEACQWVATELAIALELPAKPDSNFTEATAPAGNAGAGLPTLSRTTRAPDPLRARAPSPPGIPQPPDESGWLLA